MAPVKKLEKMASGFIFFAAMPLMTDQTMPDRRLERLRQPGRPERRVALDRVAHREVINNAGARSHPPVGPRGGQRDRILGGTTRPPLLRMSVASRRLWQWPEGRRSGL
jgi:hypothetical protein